MSLINLRDRTINAKIVYYGAALSGKTTSLKHIHYVMDPGNRTELVSLNTEGDRTLFFDFLPIPLGSLNGFQVKLQAFTVPGQVKYNITRRYVLRGADGVIFVADSRPKHVEDNAVSMLSLRDNFEANGIDPSSIPRVLQYNKRDVPGAADVAQLRDRLNSGGDPEFETIATTGQGVFAAFTEICCEIVCRMAVQYSFADPDEVRSVLTERLSALDSATPPVAPLEPLRSPGGAPLVGAAQDGDELTGIIHVQGTTGADDGTPELEELLERAVETNMESARLLAELHETRRRLGDHVAQLAALHETGVVISSELNAERLLRRVLESALATVGTHHGSILLVGPAGVGLGADLVCGFDVDPLAGTADADPAVMQRVLERKPFVIEASAESGLLKPPGVDEAGPLAALVAPMVVKDEVLGALVAYMVDRVEDADVEMRLRFLAAVAIQAAVALENARLYERVEGFNRELEETVAERTRDLQTAYRKLQKLDKLKDDFLASMSHELLTPLTSISGFAEILTATATEDGPQAAAERSEFAEIVRAEAERLTDMLQRVLDLSMLEAGHVTMTPKSVDIRKQVLASFKRFKSDFQQKKQKVRLRVAQDMPRALGDARWLARVFDALLSNAQKFGPEGTEISVTIQARDGRALIDIQDHGPGVHSGVRQVIFEKFKQLGDVLNDKTPGLGLGLPMARMILERQDGKIWHGPGAEGGSIFSISLPLAVQAAAAAPK